MTTRVGIGFVLALLSLAATGCSAAPGDGTSGGAGGSSRPSSSSSSSTGGPTGGPQGQTIDEVEPNNGPGFDGMQSLGAFDTDKTLSIKGRLDSGGSNGTSYTGDFDAFSFEIPAGGGTLTPTIDWTGSADVDVILYDANLKVVAADVTATTKPITKGGAIPAGKYAIVLLSKDLAADWTMSLAFAKGSGPAGGPPPSCPDASALTGYYFQKTHGGLEEIRFNADGSVDWGSALPQSGTIWDKGTWNLACPSLTTQLNTQASIAFTVNGTKLVDSTGVAWVRCEPVSSGECF